MRTVVLFWPNERQEDLQVEVQLDGEEYKVVRAESYRPAFQDWQDAMDDFLASEYYMDWLADSIANLEFEDEVREDWDEGA